MTELQKFIEERTLAEEHLVPWLVPCDVRGAINGRGWEVFSPKWGASWNPRKSQGSCFWKLALLYPNSYDVLWCWLVVLDGVCWIPLCFFFRISGWAEVSFVCCIVDIAMSYVNSICIFVGQYICGFRDFLLRQPLKTWSGSCNWPLASFNLRIVDVSFCWRCWACGMS